MARSSRQLAEELFNRLVDLSPAERTEQLRTFSGPDDARQEAERLLRVHDETEHATLAHVESAPDELVGSDIGPYRILERIGEGGFGAVYMAEQREPVRRKVALKVIKLGMDTRQVVARFEAERQALAMMEHPNIARVLDAGATEQGRPFFVMELVKGVPITEFCDANRLSTTTRLEIFRDVCAAVHHAHQKGVIHRDLKPSNILITLHDGRPVPKVIDFGIAKATNQRLTEKTLFTEHRQMIGTPQYMSPEQAEMSGLDIDSRADIYSLGVLLYELLTGTAPLAPEELRSAGYEQMQRMIREVDPPRPSQRLSTLGQQLPTIAKARAVEPGTLSRAIRGELDWIVMKALEKDRRRRYESAAHFAADVQRYLQQEPVDAAPPQMLYRFRKFAGRHFVAVATTTVVLLALAFGAGFSTYFALQAQDRLEALQRSEQQARGMQRKAELAAAEAERQSEQNRRLLHANLIRTAQAAIENGGAELSLELLQDTPESQRSWEWHWLQQQASDQGELLGRHAVGGIRALAYSPDGTQLASGGYDNTVRIWRVDDGQLLHTLQGHTGVVTGISWRPDGARIASSSADQTVRIWLPENGELYEELTGHTSWLAGVAYDPTGRWLASCGGNSNLRIWDAETHMLVHELGGYAHDVWSLSFSPDGNQLATSTGNGEIVLWDAMRGNRLWNKSVGNFGCWTIRFSPDGARLAVGSFDNRATVWRASDGTLLHELTGHNLPVRVAEFTPDGSTIITGGFGILRAFDANNGEPLSIRLSNQQDLHALAFHPGGERFALGGSLSDVRIWSTSAISGPLDLIGHRSLVYRTAAAPDGKLLFTVSEDGSLRAWDAVSGQNLWTRYSDRGGFYSLALNDDGRRLATCSSGEIQVWDPRTGQQVWARKTVRGVKAVAIGGNDLLAAGAPSDTDDTSPDIAIWSILSAEPLQRFDDHRGAVWGLAFDGEGRQLASAGRDGQVIVYDLPAKQVSQQITLDQGRRPHSVCFNADGTGVYIGDMSGGVEGWNIAEASRFLDFAAHNAVIGALDLTPDGRRLLTCAWHNPEVRIWNAETGDLLLELDTRITGLADVAFLPGKQGFLAAGMEGRVRIWETDVPVGTMRMRREMSHAMLRQRSAEQANTENLEAGLRIAISYRSSELYQEAEGSLRTLVEQAGERLSPDHPLTKRLINELGWTKMTRAALAAPPDVPSDLLQKLAGRYDERTFTYEDGVLVYQHDSYDTRHKLFPVHPLHYQACDIDGFRIEFVLKDDQPIKVIGHYSDGRRDESLREPTP